MKLAICNKFQVNRMNCVESTRWGGDPIDPPPPLKASCNYFFRGLLGLNIFGKAFAQEQKCSSKELTLSQYIYLPRSICTKFQVISDELCRKWKGGGVR